MNAKEMFKELGYEKAEKSESIVLYTNGCGDTISFKETKHVVLIPRDGHGALFMTCLLENAIHKQCKELGWLEKEEIAETNYEHYKDEIIEDSDFILALVDGKPCKCSSVQCSDCEFSTGNGCNEKLREWLRKPYEKTTYKLTQCEYDMLDTIFEKEARFSKVYLIGELKKKGYFKNIKCDSNVRVKDILAKCEVVG